jgi:hypothetical protein
MEKTRHIKSLREKQSNQQRLHDFNRLTSMGDILRLESAKVILSPMSQGSVSDLDHSSMRTILNMFIGKRVIIIMVNNHSVTSLEDSRRVDDNIIFYDARSKQGQTGTQTIQSRMDRVQQMKFGILSDQPIIVMNSTVRVCVLVKESETPTNRELSHSTYLL